MCNGTRLQISQLGKNVIKAKALNVTSIGEEILIHRMDMNPSETKLPFNMTRRQFPIIISFAMTINKSQGPIADYWKQHGKDFSIDIEKTEMKRTAPFP
ncbi:hypothetical protein K1719_001919 [Acacia pycnantha]|nr:hypothetical protein K1719_001919 [Acacia pycnantha]